MAIKMISSFSKKVGLPGYSSVSFGLTIESELTKIDEIEREANRAYRILQESVDRELQNPGFVPPGTYGMDPPADSAGSQRGDSTPANVTTVANWQRGPAWKCSDKQKDLILKLVDEHQLDKADVETLALERFGKGVRLLNKVEASGIIDELLETYGAGQRERRNGSAYNSNRGNRNGRNAA
jgi:hypothetical protein